MDEAEKYQQRLQAITEKRRLQEEQERAKREMEEERLRLQQLKRKSLRDQWLMDGPSSPTSSEPRSPLWGSQAQEMEQCIDKLQTESQRLAEEEEKLEQQMEDGRANAAVVVEATAEADQAVILENGQEEVEAESALLCFLSSSQSAPAAALGCEDLLKPMDPPRLDQQLLGRWALVADSSPWSLHLLPTPEPEPAWRLVQVVYIPDSISIVNGNSTFQLDMRGFWNITGVSLETSCPDFLVMSQSAPAAALACEDLLKPMDPPRLDQQLLRKWALVAGSLSHPASLESLKTRDGITMEFSPSTPNTTQNSNTTTTVHYTQTNRFGSRCESLTYNISLLNDNSTFQFDVGGRFNLTGVFLETSCPDCLVMKWEVSSRRRESTDLYLLRKTEGGREVEEEEMEEFRKQVECMGLPPPVVMEPGDALCGSHQLPWKH